MNQEKKFAPLHLHTWGSLLDGMIDMEPLMEHLKTLNIDSVAITDHGVMYGVVDFYQAAKKHGIHPVIGCEVYVAPNSRFDKKGGGDDNGRNYNHLVLLAKNQKGYQNLSKLVSIGFTEGMYYKPRIDKEVMREYSEGIICLSACLAGEVQQALIHDDYESALKSAKEHQEIFGKENYFIELQNHYLPEDDKVIKGLIKIAKEIDAEIVVTNDSHYMTKEDHEAHDVVLAMSMNKKIDDKNRMRLDNEYYIKDYDEMVELFEGYDFDVHKALANTQKIAQSCQVEFDLGTFKLPHFPYDKEKYNSSKELLEEWAMEGLHKHYGEVLPDYVLERYNYEMEIIDSKGFVDYYLLVGDYVRWAKDQGIYVGPGRGSGAGSLLAYAVGITDLDPFPEDLLFERFLNPERDSIPDFDVDFEDERRKEVMDYIFEKYGRTHVSHIMTISRAAARSILRDVAKVYDVDASQLNKLIPKTLGVTLKDAYEEVEDFRKLVDNNPKLTKIYNVASQLEGIPRHTSVHAAGLIVSDEEITNYAPLMVNTNRETGEKTVAIQATMDNIDDLGLVKVDVLGLKTLTEMKRAIESAIQDGLLPKGFNQYDIPKNDYKAYKILSEGKTKGVFQFESTGMSTFLRELKPNSEADLTLMNASYRPGPMDNIPAIITNKHNPEHIEYKHPLLEDILKDTYGYFVYQEQVMRAFQVLAGYSLGRADLIRRLMARKDEKAMEEESKYFIEGLKDEEGNVVVEGTRARGIEDKVALSILDEMKNFAQYAFNKPHANAYARLAYYTAWIKAHFPKHHMASLLTSSLGDKEKLKFYTAVTTKEMKIKVSPPDINKSDEGFKVVGDEILFGLKGLDGVGDVFVKNLIEERSKNGEFKSFYDFIKRMNDLNIGKTNLRALVLTGAFDQFNKNRRYLHENSETLLNFAKKNNAISKKVQLSLFDAVDDPEIESAYWLPKLKEFKNYTEMELFEFEKDIASLSLSYEPLDNYKKILRTGNFLTIKEIREFFEIGKGEYFTLNKNKVGVIGVLEPFETRVSKKGSTWALTEIESDGEVAEVVIFSSTLEKFSPQNKAVVVCMNGKLEVDEETMKIIAKDIVIAPNDYATNTEVNRVSRQVSVGNFKELLKDEQAALEVSRMIPSDPRFSGLYLSVDFKEEGHKFKDIRNILKDSLGNGRVYVYDRSSDRAGVWTEFNVDIYDDEMFFKLQHLLGDRNVKRFRRKF